MNFIQYMDFGYILFSFAIVFGGLFLMIVAMAYQDVVEENKKLKRKNHYIEKENLKLVTIVDLLTDEDEEA